ncbi:MAG TPA: sigma-54 dependent transcriptional regulator, partial [Oligoflexia bacterium]|nr:sigma-54 dependent transcriptional regulator [Oligoflexia bacterium]
MPENKKKVLIIDDEASVRESLQLLLGRRYSVEIAENGEVGLHMLRQMSGVHGGNDGSGEDLPDLVLLDVMMPGVDGIEMLKQIRSNYSSIPVIMVTASKTVRTVVQAMKIGAVDYLNKPFDVEELLERIDDTLNRAEAEQTRQRVVYAPTAARPSVTPVEGDLGSVVGQHPVMRDLYAKVEQLAKRDTTVLITGESGTGKEMIAREIHRLSRRGDGPFVALNCAAIPESLIESELFGHEKGAFTHAVERRLGHFELADQGTLFLDEIGELSLPVQVKMLRFLQDQEFYRVGRSKPIRVDVRILAATNRSLETAIQEGRFRQDLYYRINVVSMDIPPLRARIEDVRALAEHFIRKLSPMYGGRLPKLVPDALEVLQSYSWPGNVRELENVVESVLALGSADQ